MTLEPPPSPYVGLRPFREDDRQYFFGRERECRIIQANLLQERLTILYGPSGAGKSSILQAGVVPLLKSDQRNTVVYFRNWQSDTFNEDLIEACRHAGHIGDDEGAGANFLDLAISLDGGVFLLLDQFEDYLLYHAPSQTDLNAGTQQASFDGILARLINQQTPSVHILLGLREDALSRLDQRFSIRVPELLSNTLHVERLDLSAATDAIEKPLRVFSSSSFARDRHFEAEEQLIEVILSQVRSGQTSASDLGGKGSSQLNEEAPRVETAYLELVLAEIWNAEWRTGSSVLRLKTLESMGGASAIVKSHVSRAIATFATEEQKEIAARMFQYLVTPSRTKIAQRTADLIVFADAPEAEVKTILVALTDRADVRLLRRLSNPEQYEIFHDILAEHILEWRRQYETQKAEVARKRQFDIEAAAQQRELAQANAIAEEQRLRAQEQATAASRLRTTVRWLRLLVAISLVFACLASYEMYEARKHARIEKEIADREASTRRELDGALSQAASNALSVRAASTALEDKTKEAQRLSDLTAQAGSQARQEFDSIRVLNDEIAQGKQAATQATNRAEKAEAETDSVKQQLATKQREFENEHARLLALQASANPPAQEAPANAKRVFGNPSETLSDNAAASLHKQPVTPVHVVPPTIVQTITIEELIHRFNSQQQQIHTLTSTMEIQASVLKLKQGSVVDYTSVRAVLLLSNRTSLRLHVQVPVIGTTLLDLSSDGKTFGLWIPAKKRFIQGSESSPSKVSAIPYENLRPSQIFDWLLPREILGKDEIVLETNNTALLEIPKKRVLLHPVYELHLFVPNGDHLRPDRRITFSRDDLNPYEQFIYDADGDTTTAVTYLDYKEFNGVLFPTRVTVKLIQEDVQINFQIDNVVINKPLEDAQFKFTPPAGSEIVKMP